MSIELNSCLRYILRKVKNKHCCMILLIKTETNKECEANNVKCKLLLNPDSGYINVSFSIFIHVSSGL